MVGSISWVVPLVALALVAGLVVALTARGGRHQAAAPGTTGHEAWFRPWIGIVAGIAIVAFSLNREGEIWMCVRGSGLLLLFTSESVAHIRRNPSSRFGGVQGIRSVFLAGFIAWLMIMFLLEALTWTLRNRTH